MPELTICQIEQIIRDVRSQEITYSHLADDLIDHICCDVEDQLSNGVPFKKAYENVKKKMGTRRLKEIQEETLFAVDSKYRKMKNVMKISGITGSVLFGIAALFKIQHWAGASIMLTLGAAILSFAFLPSALGVLWKETHNKNRMVLFISGFFTAMFFILGTLFKVQHWPNAGVVITLSAFSGILVFIPALVVSKLSETGNKDKKPLYVIGALGIILYALGIFFKIHNWPYVGSLITAGFIVLGLVALPWYTLLTWKNESQVSSQFIYIIVGTLLIVIPGTLFSLSMEHSYQAGFYPHLQQQQVLYEALYKKNSIFLESYHDSLNYSKMEDIHARTAGLLKLIGDIKVKMVQESESKPGIPASGIEQVKQSEFGPGIQFMNLSVPFHPSPAMDFLRPGCSSRSELDSALLEFRKYLQSSVPATDLQKYTNLQELSSCLPADEYSTGKLTLMTGLHTLALLQNSLLVMEFNLLNATGKQNPDKSAIQ